MMPEELLQDSTHVVPLTDLMPNPWNPHRMTADEEDDLMTSVEEGGQWRPILVVAMDVADEETPLEHLTAAYRIVDGEHLYRALTALHLRGLVPNEAKVMVLGKNSEIPTWRQKEIGQTINHGLRGSLEDAQKTRELMRDLLKYRTDEMVAKRVGMGPAAVRHLAALPGKVNPGRPGVSRQGGSVATVKNAVVTRNRERQSTTIALVFETAQELQDFEASLEQVGGHLGVYRDQYKGRAGRYRIELLQRVLDDLLTGSEQDEEVTS
jgi:hypothetical protein